MKGDFEKYGMEGRENVTCDGMPYKEYMETRYIHPWYLELKKLPVKKFDNTKIHESGKYYAYFPSLPISKPFGFKLDGEIFPMEKFELIQGFSGTGSALEIYK